jgi:hypothetical protein
MARMCIRFLVVSPEEGRISSETLCFNSIEDGRSLRRNFRCKDYCSLRRLSEPLEINVFFSAIKINEK